MTKPEVERVVAVWQERLGLGRWDIKVRWERPVERGCDAEIKISEDYEQASILVQQDTDPLSDPPTRSFETWTVDDVNLTIVHELLHVFEKATRRPAAAVSSALSSSAYEVFWSWYEHGAESWVNLLTFALVDLAGPA